MTDSQATAIAQHVADAIFPQGIRTIQTKNGLKSLVGFGRMIADIVDKYRPIPSVVIEIESGCLSEVWSDTAINCTLYDWDSIRESAEDIDATESEYADRVANMQSVAVG